MHNWPALFLFCFILSVTGGVFALSKTVESEASEARQRSLTSTELDAQNIVTNPEAPIPPQCYTRTEGKFNPCYTCHQSYKNYDHDIRTNFMRDGGLQGLYAFSEAGTTNHWKNLFKDRSKAVAAMTDASILEYINQDNYSAVVNPEKSGDIRNWAPDLKDYASAEKAFDEQGHALDGSHWIAFNYKPLPSTFWPTNGSTDDVLIRLSAPFREDAQDEFKRAI